MRTTELFAELLVIGIGGCALLVTLALIAAPEAAAWSFDAVKLLIPGLAVAYVLGIVVDRFADWIFTGLFGPGSWLAITREEAVEYRETVHRVLGSSALAMDLYAYS